MFPQAPLWLLTGLAKAYSSSCSQTVSPSPAISFHGLCAAADDRKNQQNPLILEVQGLSKSSMLIRLKSSSLVLVVIGSTPMPICNSFHEKLANNGKTTTFMGYHYLMPLCAGFLEPRKSRVGPSKSSLNAENFIHSFFMSILIGFGAIRS